MRAHRAALIVDDSPPDRLLIRIALGSCQLNGVTIFEADCADEAIRQLTLHPEISLVISDVDMPKTSGYLLVERIRRDFGEEIEIILLSGRIDHNVAKQVGANFSFQKSHDLRQWESFFCNAILR